MSTISIQERGGSSVISEAALHGGIKSILSLGVRDRTRRGEPKEGAGPGDILFVPGKTKGKKVSEQAVKTRPACV